MPEMLDIAGGNARHTAAKARRLAHLADIYCDGDYALRCRAEARRAERSAARASKRARFYF